jgi:hypothetical protein
MRLTRRFVVSEGGLEHRRVRCRLVVAGPLKPRLTRQSATHPPPFVSSCPAPCWQVPVALAVAIPAKGVILNQLLSKIE